MELQKAQKLAATKGYGITYVLTANLFYCRKTGEKEYYLRTHSLDHIVKFLNSLE